jgi:hypothetical protein
MFVSYTGSLGATSGHGGAGEQGLTWPSSTATVAKPPQLLCPYRTVDELPCVSANHPDPLIIANGDGLGPITKSIHSSATMCFTAGSFGPAATSRSYAWPGMCADPVLPPSREVRVACHTVLAKIWRLWLALKTKAEKYSPLICCKKILFFR